MLVTELQHFLNNSIAVTGQNYIQPNIFYLTHTCKFILHFLCLPALIFIHELGLGDKDIENQPRLKDFNLYSILICNISKHLYFQCFLVVGQDFFPYSSHLTLTSLVATVLREPFS